MKRWFAIPLIIMLLLLAGCKKATEEPKAADTETPVPVSTTISPPTNTPAPVLQAISPDNASFIHTSASLQYPFPYWLQWSPDGNRFAASSGGGFRVYDAFNLEVLNDIQIEQYTLLDFSLAANLFAVTNDWKTIDLLDIDTGAKVLGISPPEMFTVVSFSPDGKTLSVNSVDFFAVDLWNTENGKFLIRITGFETAAPVYSLQFAGGGSKLVFLSRAKVQVIDTGSGALGAELFHEDFVQSWALSPDQKMIAVSTAATIDGAFLPVIQLWDPDSGTKLDTLLSGDKISTALAFSPDGSILASTSGGSLTLWEAAGWQRLGDWTAHDEYIASLAFSPDGSRLLTASSDGTINLWVVQ
jgi:WD40 repeat protein